MSDIAWATCGSKSEPAPRVTIWSPSAWVVRLSAEAAPLFICWCRLYPDKRVSLEGELSVTFPRKSAQPGNERLVFALAEHSSCLVAVPLSLVPEQLHELLAAPLREGEWRHLADAEVAQLKDDTAPMRRSARDLDAKRKPMGRVARARAAQRRK